MTNPRFNAVLAIARSYIKDGYRGIERTRGLMALDVPRGVIIDRTVRVESPRQVKIARAVSIGRNSALICREDGQIIVNEHVSIGPNVTLIAEQGGIIEIGEHTVIGSNVMLRSRSTIRIGARNEILAFSSIEPREDSQCGNLITRERVTIHTYNFLDTTGDITIDVDTHTGPFCMFYTHNHNFSAPGSIWAQGIRVEPIMIGPGVWMGSKVLVMPGAVVGDNSVIAAGSVVTRKYGADEVLIGAPATVKRKRVLTLA